ncbi:MAG: hypothetical protein HKN10_10515, partial [Myxococcales bacterium]|nr:hypothetical protein [Myxococcales bacterium]
VSGRDLESFIHRCLVVRRVRFDVLNCTSANVPEALSLKRSRQVLNYQPVDGLQRLPRPTPEPVRDQPVIVVGSIRGGTTILSRCLGGHPQLRSIGFELTREWRKLAGLAMSTSANEDPGCPAYDADHGTPELLERAREGFCELAADNGVRPGMRWLMKNPHLWNKLPLVRAIFPRATLVVTGRDLRSTVASLKQLWSAAHVRHGTRYYLPKDKAECFHIARGSSPGVDPSRVFPEGGVAVLADYWLRTYECIGREAGEFTSAFLVRHRDLVDDSGAVLRPIFESMGLQALDAHYHLEEREKLSRPRLGEDEHRVLDRFIRKHQHRIDALEWADTTTELHDGVTA